jgi:hypothetical protein
MNAYRSGYQQIIGTRIATLRRAREHFEPYLPELRSVRAARVARIVGGAAGVAGAAAMAITSAMTSEDHAPMYALIGGGVAAVASWLVTRIGLGVAGRFRFGISLKEKLPMLSGHLANDLESLDQSDPLPRIERHLSGLELWSTSLPLIAMSLLMPLTLHLIVAPLFGPHYDFTRSYSEWIRISLVIVGHAHLAVALLSYLFARKMKKMETSELATLNVNRSWAKAWGITIGVSAVPGVVLLLVPPILTALTGLLFIPAMFFAMHSRTLKERRVIEMAVTDASTNVRVGSIEVPPSSFEDSTLWYQSDSDQQQEESRLQQMRAS